MLAEWAENKGRREERKKGKGSPEGSSLVSPQGRRMTYTLVVCIKSSARKGELGIPCDPG